MNGIWYAIASHLYVTRVKFMENMTTKEVGDWSDTFYDTWSLGAWQNSPIWMVRYGKLKNWTQRDDDSVEGTYMKNVRFKRRLWATTWRRWRSTRKSLTAWNVSRWRTNGCSAMSTSPNEHRISFTSRRAILFCQNTEGKSATWYSRLWTDQILWS